MNVPRGMAIAATLWITVAALGISKAQEDVPAKAGSDNSHSAILMFAHSEDCIACHNQLVTPTGEDVSIGRMWRSTMMANSARDPYWQAAVRRETLDHPRHAASIEDECAGCHMPMATRVARAEGVAGGVFNNLPIRVDASAKHRLAADGISCTVCHQIASDALGTRASFNGAFALAPTPPNGQRAIFGPFPVDTGQRTIMRSVTGFVQEEAPHISESRLCATCHTLITDAFGPDGAIIGSLPEQMNFQEWQHSDFEREQRTCQSCHMPRAPGPVRVSSVLGERRDTLARHVFVGGNSFMLRMLNRHRDELGVEASAAELDATAAATVRQLQQDTATIAIERPDRSSGSVEFDVAISNLTGHKFPTGYPARRTWLHVLVRGAAGELLFESGAIGADGAIAGNDSDRGQGRFEPHYDEITSPEQVQVYEAILGDRNGVPTTGLLTATQYLKDNRFLPRGFDKATAASEIAVHGEALSDATFTGGRDRVHYRIAAPPGPVSIEVELRYQAIAYRWAHNLSAYDADEPKRFVGYYTAMANDASVLVASAHTWLSSGRAPGQ